MDVHNIKHSNTATDVVVHKTGPSNDLHENIALFALIQEITKDQHLLNEKFELLSNNISDYSLNTEMNINSIEKW